MFENLLSVVKSAARPFLVSGPRSTPSRSKTKPSWWIVGNTDTGPKTGFGEITPDKSASVERFKVLSPLGWKTRKL